MPDEESAAPGAPLAPRDTLFRNSKGKVRPAPQVVATIADTHAHLDMLADPALSLARCAMHGVEFICDVVDPSENTTAYGEMDAWLEGARGQLAAWEAPGDALLPGIRYAVGVHPHNARLFTREAEQRLIRCAADARTACIGEIGLDYHYDMSPRPLQREVFELQLGLARQMGLPVSLHIREAHADALTIIERVGLPQAGCILHCFNFGPADLAPWLELGCHIAFGGPLTFKKSDDTRAALPMVPLDKLLTETDAPFMAPEPLRGTECSPEYTVFTAALLARIYAAEHPGIAEGGVLDAAYSNARALLDRPATPWQDDAAAACALEQRVACCLADGESATL